MNGKPNVTLIWYTAVLESDEERYVSVRSWQCESGGRVWVADNIG